MTNSMKLSSLIALNEKAIWLMRTDKDYMSAYSMFNQGLAHLETLYDENVEEDSDVVMMCDDDENDDQNTATIGALVPVDAPRVGDNGAYSLYCNALTLVKVPKSSNPANWIRREEVFDLLYAVMVYNSALCLHWNGICTGRDSDVQSAIPAYETALGLIGDLERLPFVMVLELAILNNCGHVHYHLSEARDLHTVLKLMKNTLCSITHGWTREIPDQVSSFSTNILMNAQNYARPAAAA